MGQAEAYLASSPRVKILKTMPGVEKLDEVPASHAGRKDFTWPHFHRWQWAILIVLTLLNLLNYFDRQIILPMFPLLQDEFGISDFRLGLLSSAFILVHSLSALPFGYWSDRGPRQKIMAGGTLFWSFATIASGLATSFRGLLVARGLLGIGEGAYAPAGTATISDSFPLAFRARVQSIFNMGMLVGGVLGIAVGGVLAEWIGWRKSFLLVAAPGFLLTIATLHLHIPPPPPPVKRQSAWKLFGIPAFVTILIGGALAAFAAASFVTWGPVFGTRYHDLSIARASVVLGAMVLAGSVMGVLFGGYVADYLQQRWPFGRALSVGSALILGTPFLWFAVQADSEFVFFACTFAATFLLTCYHGPTTAVIHDITPTDSHALAFAIYLFFVHFFGDTAAPALVGLISDRRELRSGMHVAVVANLLAGLCFLLVAEFIRRRKNGVPEEPAVG
jgi:MFS transporter, Spinster family, sphingosine-1-phosphate transporter